MTDCSTCHHDATSHNTGTCVVLQSSSLARGLEDYTAQGGCGCTAMPFDMVCTTCAQPFVCAQGHPAHECLRCHQIAKGNRDLASFQPLIDALRARNLPVEDTDIWNTGGNIMCLALRVTEDPKGPYVMWSDDAEYIGFGVYPDDEHVGLFVSPLGEEGERPDDSWSWAYRDNAERAADLAMRAIPQVVRWLDAQTFTTRDASSSFGPYTVREMVAPYSPLVVEGAQVEDFGA